MDFIDRNIMRDEKILYLGEVHWAVFLWTFTLGGIGLILFGLDFAIMAAVLIAVAELRWWPAFINYAVSVFAVTNKRVIARVGFFRRASLVVPFADIKRLDVVQGKLGRILGCGTLVITVDGGSKYTFYRMASPLELQSRINEQILRSTK